MLRTLFAWMSKYERHLSAAAMIAGFIADNLLFERVDLWKTQAVFATYTAVCFVAIALLHFIEARAESGEARPRWRSILPIATQFSLGGFWSGFLIFYGRSAVLDASWPFLLLLFAIFIGNEYFARYHDRLVFTSILFFFALYSYAIFAVPIYTGTMGTLVFLESGVAATIVFSLFTVLLRIVARERFRADLWRIRVGAATVLVLINFFYFTNVLPPLPLAAKAAGIYHDVRRTADAYQGDAEPQSWKVQYLGAPALEHVAPGDSLYAYSSVFAPTILTTTIVHRWQWYDPTKKAWVTEAAISYPIAGGRDGGYRGYSALLVTIPGSWRVNVETIDGRLIARLPFTVVPVTVTAPTTTETLN